MGAGVGASRYDLQRFSECRFFEVGSAGGLGRQADHSLESVFVEFPAGRVLLAQESGIVAAVVAGARGLCVAPVLALPENSFGSLSALRRTASLIPLLLVYGSAKSPHDTVDFAVGVARH